MKTFIRGNQVLVQTDIEEEDYEKYQEYGVFTAIDAKGDQVYKVAKTVRSSFTPFGIGCNTVYQGKLAASTEIPADMEVEGFINRMKPAMLALKENETIIKEQVAEMERRLQGIDETIEIEE